MKQEKNYSAKFIFTLFKNSFFSIFDLKRDTDVDSTLEDVKASVGMSGQTAWVLIFSILIASAGLNTNSTAVVIGAMLISPLMGPIVGMGLSLGINDIDLFKRAIINFNVMVLLSLITSTLFFSVPLFQNETPEILARTFPDVRDVIIAFSGGLALIIALTRRNKIYNLIAGVAIATALMPPLCTAGYGFATGKWDFFRGAIFLFSINTVFIASATFIVIRLLNFPYEKYTNSAQRKRMSRIISIIAVGVLIPSFYTFYQLYKKSDFEQKADVILNGLSKEKGVAILEVQKDYKAKEVSFYVVGKNLENSDTNELKNKMKSLGHENINFKIEQDASRLQTIQKIETLESYYLATQQQLLQKQDEINQLQLKNKKDSLKAFNFDLIRNEIKALNPLIEKVSYVKTIESNFQEQDTITQFLFVWNKKVSKQQIQEENTKLQNWLRIKLANNKVAVKNSIN